MQSKEIRNYLDRNFITLDDLQKATNLTEKQIRDFIEQRCFPHPSYVIKQTESIYSHLSGKSETIFNKTEEYFHPSMIDWLKQIENEKPSSNLAYQLYSKFESEYQQSILQRSAKQFGFDGSATENWDHLLNGIYGICIKGPITADNIIRKAVAVHRVASLTDNGSAQSIAAAKKNDLLSALKEFDAIVADFAPHDRPASSRKRLFDDVIRRLGLEEEFTR